MASFNKVILIGNLTADPEIRQTQSQISVCRFTIAVNRRFARSANNGDAQNQQQTADFITVVAWRQSAEFVARYFRKGQAMCVTGKLQNRSCEKNGETRWVTEIVADEINFVDNANSNQQSAAVAPQNNAGSAQTATPTNNAPQAQTPQSVPQQQYYGSQDDDLPF